MICLSLIEPLTARANPAEMPDRVADIDDRIDGEDA
jgi:hypothetical protein